MCLYGRFFRFKIISKTIKVSTFSIVQFGTLGLDWAKRIIIMDYVHDPYEVETDVMGENIHVENAETKSNGRRNQVIPPDITETMRGLGVEMQSYRENNERLIIVQEEHNQLNETMLQSLTCIQRNIKSIHHSKN